MKGVGGATTAKLRALASAGGWMDGSEWFALHGRRGNRTPFLISDAKLLDSFSYCRLKDRQQRIGYRLTEAGRAYLEGLGL